MRNQYFFEPKIISDQNFFGSQIFFDPKLLLTHDLFVCLSMQVALIEMPTYLKTEGNIFYRRECESAKHGDKCFECERSNLMFKMQAQRLRNHLL